MDKMQTQSKEFDAAAKFKDSMNSLFATPIVDDDYPEVRSRYEGALESFVAAMKTNGRFKPGNRYGLKAA